MAAVATVEVKAETLEEEKVKDSVDTTTLTDEAMISTCELKRTEAPVTIFSSHSVSVHCRRGIHDITSQIASIRDISRVEAGLCHLLCECFFLLYQSMLDINLKYNYISKTHSCANFLHSIFPQLPILKFCSQHH